VTRPKIIATDLDGTIIPFDGHISKRTIETFTKAHDLGIHIFFITGRPPRWMNEVREAFSFGTGVCGNGAVIYDFHKNEILEECLISVEDLNKATQALRASMPSAVFAVENHDGFHREQKYLARWDLGIDDAGSAQIEEHFDQPAMKFLVRSLNHELSSDEMLEIAQKELKGIATATHSNSSESLLEISAVGVSKGETLAKLAQRLNISASDVITFGDNPNDISMLEWSGRSYAMATAHPAAQAAAKSIAPECNDDGVAQVLEELI
jgi:Cof subfamily protein (haloacid dehalogenase superfamily)